MVVSPEYRPPLWLLKPKASLNKRVPAQGRAVPQEAGETILCKAAKIEVTIACLTR